MSKRVAWFVAVVLTFVKLQAKILLYSFYLSLFSLSISFSSQNQRKFPLLSFAHRKSLLFFFVFKQVFLSFSVILKKKYFFWLKKWIVRIIIPTKLELWFHATVVEDEPATIQTHPSLSFGFYKKLAQIFETFDFLEFQCTILGLQCY